MKEPLSLPDRGLHLIFPAIFRKGKNQDLIIKAFAHFIVRSKDQNSSLFLPGDGPLLDEMKSLAKTLGIADRVYFPGYCTRNTLCELERKKVMIDFEKKVRERERKDSVIVKRRI